MSRVRPRSQKRPAARPVEEFRFNFNFDDGDRDELIPADDLDHILLPPPSPPFPPRMQRQWSYAFPLPGNNHAGASGAAVVAPGAGTGQSSGSNNAGPSNISLDRDPFNFRPLQPAQENAVSEGSERSLSPSGMNTYEADPTSVVETSQYDCSSIADNWCQTQMNVIKFNYMWTINNFSYCHEEMGEVLKSSTFGSGNNDKMRWCLRINPKGLDDESKDYLSLYLLLVQSNKPDVRAKFKFSILNADREESKAMESQRAYRFVQGKDWGFKKFIRRDYLLDELNGLLPDDKLSIYCEVSIVTDAVNVTGQNSMLQLTVPSSCFSDDFDKLFTDELFSDCEIVVGEKSFRAHKGVLSARSEVFRAMFTHTMCERNSDCVHIDDLDAETVRGMLHFVYSDNVPDLDSLAIKLLAAADKYSLKRLKVMCERALCLALTTGNVCQILVHADLHSADQLKTRCVSFINQHSLAIMETEGWAVLARDYGPLLAQVFKAMATQQVPVSLSPARKRARHY